MKSLNILIAAFATLLVGIMLISTVATQTYAVTGRGIQVMNETLDTSAARDSTMDAVSMNGTVAFTLNNKGVKCGNGEGGWVSGSVQIANASGRVLNSGNYTVNYANSSIYFKNTTTTDIGAMKTAATGAGFFNGSNNTMVTYQYYANDYLCEGWSRAGLNLVPGFFGIAVLLISVALFYQVAKNEGIVGQL